MTEPYWLFYPCPKCGNDFTQSDQYGVFCCISGCGWKAEGEEAEQFRKDAAEAQEEW